MLGLLFMLIQLLVGVCLLLRDRLSAILVWRPILPRMRMALYRLLSAIPGQISKWITVSPLDAVSVVGKG